MAVIDRRGITVGETEPPASLYAHSGLFAKAPVVAATTANITLSGLQTIDGIPLSDGDRVLVKNQTTGSENGIYIASTGDWLRSGDFDGLGEVAKGTQVFVVGGTTQSLSNWYVSTDNPITVGTTALSFAQLSQTINTYSELQALTSTGTVYVGGRDAVGDGAQGYFDWKSGDQSSNIDVDEVGTNLGNGGIWVAPSSDLTGASGAWKRAFIGFVHSLWYAKCDDSTDDLAALNQFNSNAGTYSLYIDNGTYRISAALDAINQSDVHIYGDGVDAIIKYTGASTTPGDLMTFGNGTTLYNDLTLNNFSIDSGIDLSGGYAINIKYFTDVRIDLRIKGVNLHKGMRLDNVSYCWLGSTDFYTEQNRLDLNDCIEVNAENAEFRSVTMANGYHVHIGGGCGGIYLQNSNGFGGSISVYVDTALADTEVLTGTTTSGAKTITGLSSTSDLVAGMTVSGTGIVANSYITTVDSSSQVTINQNATASGSVSLTFFNGNSQLFFGNSVWDSATSAALYLNDSTVRPAGKMARLDNAYFAAVSAGSGYCQIWCLRFSSHAAI